MRVTKYNANGNDFIIFHDSKKQRRNELARLLCDRHRGVGADGMVVLVPHPEYDFEWEFYNSDGSEAEMCGNAARAAAHYAAERGISVNNRAEFLTGAGVIRAEINGLYVISDMLPPKIIDRSIEEQGRLWWLIDTGVPHLVSETDDIEDFDLKAARELRQKYDANVNIYTAAGGEIRIRTYERGVEDETLACGTGITAAFVKAEKEGKAGELCAVFPRSGDELYMELKEGRYRFGGKVEKTFIAELTLDIPS